MSDLLWHLLWNALEASILAVLLGLVLTRLRLSAATRCALWSFVLLKLVIPPGFTHSLALSGFLRDASSAASSWIVPATPAKDADDSGSREPAERAAGGHGTRDLSTARATSATPSPSPPTAPMRAALTAIRRLPMPKEPAELVRRSRGRKEDASANEKPYESISPRAPTTKRRTTTRRDDLSTESREAEPTVPPGRSVRARLPLVASDDGDGGHGTGERFARREPSAGTISIAPGGVTKPDRPRVLFTRTNDLEVGSFVTTLWAAGAVAFLLLQVSRLVLFGLRLRSLSPAPSSVQSLSNDLARRIGLRRSPPVRVLPRDTSPLVWACGPPVILIPPRLALARGAVHPLEAVLAHELAHLKRRDHWVAWLEVLSGAAYFWLPTYWWSRRRVRDAADEAADALATRQLSSREAYAEGLLGTLQLLNSPRRPLPPLAHGIGGGTTLKNRLSRRLTMILREPLASRTAWHVRVVLAVIALFVLPAGAASSPGSKPDDADRSDGASTGKDSTSRSGRQGDSNATRPADRLGANTADSSAPGGVRSDPDRAGDTGESAAREELDAISLGGVSITLPSSPQSSGAEDGAARSDAGASLGGDANDDDTFPLDGAFPGSGEVRPADAGARSDGIERRLANLERVVERILGELEQQRRERRAAGSRTAGEFDNVGRYRPARAGEEDHAAPDLEPVSGRTTLGSDLDPTAREPRAEAGDPDLLEDSAIGRRRRSQPRAGETPGSSGLLDTVEESAPPSVEREIQRLQRRIAELEARNQRLIQRLREVLQQSSRAPVPSRSVTEMGLAEVAPADDSPYRSGGAWRALRKPGAEDLTRAVRAVTRAFDAAGLDCDLLRVRARDTNWVARIHIDAETWTSVHKGFGRLLQTMPLARVEDVDFALSADKSVVAFDLVLGQETPLEGPPLTLDDVDRLVGAITDAGYEEFALQATSSNLRTARPRVEVKLELHGSREPSESDVASLLSSVSPHYEAEMELTQRDGEHEITLRLLPRSTAELGADDAEAF